MSVDIVLDRLSRSDADSALLGCCGSRAWVAGMLARRPFGSVDNLLAVAEEVWSAASREDVLEALSHHPRIGDDLDALRAKFSARDLALAGGEQASVREADEATLTALRDGNREYERRFGYIFVVCATGKSAGEMLELLRSRLDNDPDDEWRIAAREQGAITRLRLQKLEEAR